MVGTRYIANSHVSAAVSTPSYCPSWLAGSGTAAHGRYCRKTPSDYGNLCARIETFRRSPVSAKNLLPASHRIGNPIADEPLALTPRNPFSTVSALYSHAKRLQGCQVWPTSRTSKILSPHLQPLLHLCHPSPLYGSVIDPSDDVERERRPEGSARREAGYPGALVLARRRTPLATASGLAAANEV